MTYGLILFKTHTHKHKHKHEHKHTHTHTHTYKHTNKHTHTHTHTHTYHSQSQLLLPRPPSATNGTHLPFIIPFNIERQQITNILQQHSGTLFNVIRLHHNSSLTNLSSPPQNTKTTRTRWNTANFPHNETTPISTSQQLSPPHLPTPYTSNPLHHLIPYPTKPNNPLI